MPAEIVNLRRARKAKARSEREKTADQNRRLFGRTAAEKRKDDDERQRALTHIEGHRIDSGEDEPA